MFKRLQQKWGVSTRQFWVIFLAFALTGTSAAYITRYLTHWLGMDASTHWGWKLLLRLGMLLIGYQFLLLFYGWLLGEWKFFWSYEKKLLRWLGVSRFGFRVEEKFKQEKHPTTSKLFIHDSFQTKPETRNPKPHTPPNPIRRGGQTPNQLQTSDHRPQTILAIFASGAGSNAEKIITHLENHPSIRVALVVCNKPEAGVLSVAKNHGVPSLLIEKERFFRGDAYLPELQARGIDFIVLAGFLWKVPDALIQAYPRKIINIHPALLPKYGGKGMYGNKVHEAVLAAKDRESGITIHYVNEHFDEGEHIFQARCEIAATDTPELLAQKIHALEHAHFPIVVEQLIMNAANGQS